MGNSTKYTLELSSEQNEELAQIQKVLKASSKADAIRRALGLAALAVEVTNQSRKLAILNENGDVIETLRFV
jgi:hypothetical protein